MRGGACTVVAAALSLMVGLTTVPAAAQRVIPPGRETVILEAVQQTFGEERAQAIDIERDTIRVRTADGPTLVARRTDHIHVDMECDERCSPALRSRWDPIAERFRLAIDARAEQIWQGRVQIDVEPTTYLPRNLTASPLRAVSYLLLALLAMGLVVAPRPRPAGSRRDAALALLLVLGFLAVVLTLGDPRPLHDHLCNLERAQCAADPFCDQVHGAWGRPTFHAMGLLLRALPERLPWILGIGAVLMSVTLWLVYDVTSRVAVRSGVPDERAGEAGLWALACAALHPGVVRVAGAGSFWPLTLLLTFAALHLVLRAAPAPDDADSRGATSRESLGIIGAGAAFTLALGGNRLALVLLPLVGLAPWAWRHRSRRPWPLLLATLVAGLAPLVYFGVATHAVLSADMYGAQSRLDVDVLATAERVAEHVFALRYTSVLALPLLLVAVCSRGRARALLPLAYAFGSVRFATFLVTDSLNWEWGYPDAYLKHFSHLVLAAPLMGVGAFVVVRFLADFPRTPRSPRLVTALAAAALVVSIWAPPDARRLLFAHRVMERELVGMVAAFDALPAHDRLVFAPLVPPPEGMSPRGDPLEMHFPIAPYREALEARGLRPGSVLPLEALEQPQADDRRTLLYVGSTLRTFYEAEVEAGLLPDNFERPELRALRDRYTLEPAHLFSVPTASAGGIDRPLAAGRVPTIELGFYWVTRRATGPAEVR